jgi:hypothetical protein
MKKISTLINRSLRCSALVLGLCVLTADFALAQESNYREPTLEEIVLYLEAGGIEGFTGAGEMTAAAAGKCGCATTADQWVNDTKSKCSAQKTEGQCTAKNECFTQEWVWVPSLNKYIIHDADPVACSWMAQPDPPKPPADGEGEVVSN